jgi:hypothetical protein
MRIIIIIIIIIRIHLFIHVSLVIFFMLNPLDPLDRAVSA